MRSSSYLPALRAERQKAATRGERAIGALFPNRGIGWSADWSGNRAEQVSHYRNWTFVAVDAIASKVASVGMPNMAYVVDSPSRRAVKACNRLPGAFGQDVYVSDGGHGFLTVGAYRRKALSVIKPHEMLEPLEADHPLRRLIDNPNPYDTTFNLMYELQMFEELCGVSYLWTPLNWFGMPCEMWVMPSHWVWPRTGGGSYVDPNNPHADELIQFYEIRPWGTQGSAGYLRILPNEIIMNLWKSPIDKIGGYSKLAAIAQWIDSEESISKSRWAQFQNQARPELWVELGPGYEDPDDLMISRIEAKIAAKLQGEYNYGKPIITPPGAKLTPLSFNPTEMAYFQSEEQIRDMILSTFRVPPSAVGIVKEMTYGSILATLAAFCAYCLNPRLTSRGQMMTKRLASRWDRPGRRVRLWYDDCVPADPQQVNSDIDTDARNYAITPNEVRALRGRRPYRVGGSDPIVSGPGGPMPLPLNTGDSLEDFAKLVEPMASVGQQGGGEEGGEQEGADRGGQDQDALAQALGQVQAEEPDETDLAEDTAAPEEPNGKPSKSYRGWVEKKLGPFSYASTQLDLKQDDTPDNTGRYAWEHVRRMAEAVRDEDLAADGREEDPHLTILYGLEDENPDAVHRLVHDFGPVTFTLGKTVVFRTEGADVVVIEATGDGLKALRQRVAALRHTDKYPEYKPHVTVAYVKPGAGAKYAGRADVDGLEVTVNTLTFSDRDGNKTYLHMAGYGHGGQVVRGAGATVTKKVPGPTFRGAGAPSPRATVKDKTTGTCKPGETAARTGCTPASGGGGKKPGKKPTSDGDKTGGKKPAAPPKKTGGHPGAAHGSTVKITKTDKRAFNGRDPLPTKSTLTKQETGRVGEAVAVAYMKEVLGAPDARPMNTERTNFPIDLIEDHRPTEVKAGLCSNGAGAQQWRLTFSQESKEEKAAYEQMTPEQRAEWNAEKQRRIHERKKEVIAKLEEAYGQKVHPRTLTLVINPDTQTADVYVFDGFHDRIGWRSPEAQKAYQGSVNYDHE